MKILIILEIFSFFLFALCAMDQQITMIKSRFSKNRHKTIEKTEKKNRYAFLIPARNEEIVIGNLVQSINMQNYPSELIDIYVICDRCSDNTNANALEAGAYTIILNENKWNNKAYVLNYAYKQITSSHPTNYYDAFAVFDADNLLDAEYIANVNDYINNKYDFVVGYRNSKNFDESYCAVGTGMMFLRDSGMLNRAKQILGRQCWLSGTGYVVCALAVHEINDFAFSTITEDIEINIKAVDKALKIGYAERAVYYDEQPVSFRTMVSQKIRWMQGCYQLFGLYKKWFADKILKEKNIDALAIFTYGITSTLIALFIFIVNIAAFIISLVCGKEYLIDYFMILGGYMLIYYLFFLIMGCVIMVGQHKYIHCSCIKQFAYGLLFPITMIVYIPCAFVALVGRKNWKKIEHRSRKKITDYLK